MRILLRTARPVAGLLLVGGLALLLGACSSMTGGGNEDENRLVAYLQNAASYYDRGHYRRAYQQWDKALELDSGNVKCRLGQAMCMYQLGRAPTREGLQRLVQAEEALTDLLDEDLEGQEWKAQMGYALVQEHWVRLYDERIRLSERDMATGSPVNEQELADNRKEMSRRIRLAEEMFRTILSGGEQEVRDELTCQLSLARLTFLRGDLEASLGFCEKYADQVERSKKLWRDAAARFPKERPIYEAKLDGAERQEAELRDLMGNVLFKLGRMDEAKDQLDKVIVLDQGRASAYLNRGLIYHEKGDWDRARADYTEFLARSDLPETDPTVREATSRLLEVEELVEAEDDLRRKLDTPRR